MIKVYQYLNVQNKSTIFKIIRFSLVQWLTSVRYSGDRKDHGLEASLGKKFTRPHLNR
jgi:hypothetical protein